MFSSNTQEDSLTPVCLTLHQKCIATTETRALKIYTTICYGTFFHSFIAAPQQFNLRATFTTVRLTIYTSANIDGESAEKRA